MTDMSPETLGKSFLGRMRPSGDYSHKQADAWALGIVLFQLITGRQSWVMATKKDPTYKLFFADPRWLKRSFKLSEDAYKVLTGLLNVDPDARRPLVQIREEILKIKTFYQAREGLNFRAFTTTPARFGIPSGDEVPYLSRTSSVSSIDSTAPVTPETLPTHPDIEVPELDEESDVVTSMIDKMAVRDKVISNLSIDITQPTIRLVN